MTTAVEAGVRKRKLIFPGLSSAIVSRKTKENSKPRNITSLSKTKRALGEANEIEGPKALPIPSTRNSKLPKRLYWSLKSTPLLVCISGEGEAAGGKRFGENVGKKVKRLKLSNSFNLKIPKFNRMKEEYWGMNERLSTLPIEEVEEESTLVDYWEKKEEYCEKYKKMLLELESEERAEIRCKTSRLTDAGDISAITQQINEEYSATRELILRQKILEEEAILSQYEKIVFSSQK